MIFLILSWQPIHGSDEPDDWLVHALGLKPSPSSSSSSDGGTTALVVVGVVILVIVIVVVTVNASKKKDGQKEEKNEAASVPTGIRGDRSPNTMNRNNTVNEIGLSFRF